MGSGSGSLTVRLEERVGVPMARSGVTERDLTERRGVRGILSELSEVSEGAASSDGAGSSEGWREDFSLDSPEPLDPPVGNISS